MKGLLPLVALALSLPALGETLYNGLELPAEWPPRTQDPKSAEPMPVPWLAQPPKVIPIDIGRQLFIDNFLIEKTDLARTYYQAKKFAGNPVFKPETIYELQVKPGAGTQSAVCYLGHGGVFWDPAAQHFKMFYTAGWRGGLALATSPDLKTWTRPELGLAGGNLLRAPGNAIAGGDDAVWLDLTPKNPAERIKFLTNRDKTETTPGGHFLSTSADGRAWSDDVPTGPADDYCSFFFNPFRQVWVQSIKRGGLGRARWYSENADFLKSADWKPGFVFWANADQLDEPDPAIGETPQLYSLNAVAYESILLGEFYILQGPNNKICGEGKFPKTTELKLGFSRDGFHWHRPDRRPFIGATHQDGDWDRAYLHGTMGVCAVMGDQLVFPYCAYSGLAPDGTRGMYVGASIGLATLRRDGFASMDAGATPGTLLTRPVTFTGSRLFVNLAAPAGELRVEVLDESGAVLAPFSEETSVPIRADSTRVAVTWKDGADLATLRGRPVRFRFQLTSGSLYAFWVSGDASGASRGYVGAGGPEFPGVVDTVGSAAPR